MITIIIPTRNRAYTIEKVAESYYRQKYVTEIIFVDDCGEDNTKEVIEKISKNYPNVNTKYICHETRKGASASRITGYTKAMNEYVLFGEDDAFLESNYTEVILAKLKSTPKIGLVSGRIIYMLPQESVPDSLQRFGIGFESKPYLDKNTFTYNKNAKIAGDFSVPFTHALFMTTKKLLEEFSYDPFYGQGNGYREETDFQLNAFVHGYEILVTNDTHCCHLHTADVPSGGQRSSRFRQLYWNIFYTGYMYDKYYDLFKQPLGLKYPKLIAKLIFSIAQFNLLFVRPAFKLPAYLYKRLFQ